MHCSCKERAAPRQSQAGLSSDLDALAAYVASLNAFASSPYRNSDGSLTANGVAGRAIFVNLNCAQCHGGPNFTDSAAANLTTSGPSNSDQWTG
jgi:cytochrome c peroxidase